MISVTDLIKSFAGAKGEVRALRGVSFEVGKGELFTLLGASGCGKTTTLRCIAGLEQPLSGQILVDGKPVFSANEGVFVPPERRNIGMVFQSYAIWPHMTVQQNVAYPLTKAAGQAEIGQRVRNILERLGLAHLADRLAPNLSGGQQQRVALARALVYEPNILLLDEPLSNLDAKLREQMRFELKTLQESFGITTVYVTHDQEEALALSDRIGLMHEGILVEVGAPADLYLRPAHRVTADFLGTANFVAAQAERVDGEAADEVRLSTPIGRFAARLSGEWRPGVSTQLFFRPESVEICDDGVADGKLNHGAGKVERVTFLGNAADVIVDCNQIKLRLRTHPARTPKVNEQVSFFVEPEACIAFPAPRAPS